jgi:hypothetical protein
MAVNLTDAQIKKLFPTYFTSDYQGQITAAKIKKILKLYSDKEGGRTYIGDKLKLNQVVVGRILNIAENKNIIKRVDPKEFKTNKALKLYDNPADRKILNAIRPVTNIDRTKNPDIPSSAKYKIVFATPNMRIQKTTKIPEEFIGIKYFDNKAEANKALTKRLKTNFQTPDDPDAAKLKVQRKRSKRLDTTVGGQARFLRGSEAFPFHHIMPIGGETLLTTNDVAVITKQMNSKLSPYNVKLNNIADAISTVANNQQPGYIEKITQLNNSAEEIVAKATKELPNKFKPYIGFTRLDPITDEYGTLIRLTENRVGAVKEKGIPLRDLNFDQLTKLKASIKKLTEKEKIGYCSLLSRGGLPGDCAAAIDNDPVKAAQIFDEAPATSTAMAKVKNAAKGFLQSPILRGAGKFGALAAVGAATAGAVKAFMNDDPTTYLSNEEQQKNLLIDMVTGSLDDTPQESPAILDYQLPVLGAGAVAGTAAVAPSTIEAARSGALGATKSGITKTALKTLGRGLTALGTPAALLATEPLFIAGQVQQGDSLTDIATNPMNYLGAAFAGPATAFATKGINPTIAKTMRLGISPSVLKTVSRRFGLPGLALSAGISGYELFDDYRNKRGMFSAEE